MSSHELVREPHPPNQSATPRLKSTGKEPVRKFYTPRASGPAAEPPPTEPAFRLPIIRKTAFADADEEVRPPEVKSNKVLSKSRQSLMLESVSGFAGLRLPSDKSPGTKELMRLAGLAQQVQGLDGAVEVRRVRIDPLSAENLDVGRGRKIIPKFEVGQFDVHPPADEEGESEPEVDEAEVRHQQLIGSLPQGKNEKARKKMVTANRERHCACLGVH